MSKIYSNLQNNKGARGVWLTTEEGGDVHVHTERDMMVIGLNKNRATPTPAVAVGIAPDRAFIQVCPSGDLKTAKQIEIPAAVVAGWLTELAMKAQGYAATCTQPPSLADNNAAAVGVIVAPPVA